MKRIRLFFTVFTAAFVMAGCKTDDVGEPTITIDPARYYEINDLFAGYLRFNSSEHQTTNNYKMPEDIVILHKDKWYLDKDLAKTLTGTSSSVYLSQASGNLDDLANAGFSREKIKSVDGIQFFTEVRRIYLNDTEVPGDIDLANFPNLTVFQANRTLLSSVRNVPAGVTDFRCSANVASTVDQRLSSLDLSACTVLERLDLENGVQIPSGELKLPEAPTAASITVNASGSLGLPYPCSFAFYNKLTTASKTFFESATVQVDANLGARLLTAGLSAGTITYANDIYLLDKSRAAAVTTLNISQTGTPSGKITSISDLRHFSNLTSLDMTDTEVSGAADFSVLPKLVTLKMSGNLCGSVTLPSTIETFDYNANTGAAAGQKLTAINFGACNNLQSASLKNHTITTFAEPAAPVKSNIAIDLAGNTPAAAFEVLAVFYNKLTVASQAFFVKAAQPEAGSFSIVWDPSVLIFGGRDKSQWPTDTPSSELKARGISNIPQINRTDEAYTHATAGTLPGSSSADKAFGFYLGHRDWIRTTAEEAVAANQFATITIMNSPTSALNLTFTNIITTVWRSGAGVNRIALQYSVNNGTSYLSLTTTAYPDGYIEVVEASNQTNATGSVRAEIDLSSIPPVTPGNSLIIRLVPYGKLLGSSNNGVCAFASAQRDAPVNTFSINGTAIQP